MTESTTEYTPTQYTTGELAKRCGVSVRTVQYYDNRGVLVPSEVSSGGRRLYDEQDVRRLSVITFLRGLGFSISQIADLLADDQSSAYIDSLIAAQRMQLSKQIELDQSRLRTLDALHKTLGRVDDCDRTDLHAFSDAAFVTRRKTGLKRIHGTML
ncbi:MAG: MerR family transcriptional regulator, partial [Bifidobacterium sp.]